VGVHLLDIEWLLSTLFDASLLKLRAAGNGGSFFVPRYVFSAPTTPSRRARSLSVLVLSPVRRRQLCRKLYGAGAGQRVPGCAMVTHPADRGWRKTSLNKTIEQD
jgi:hypothetical protein